VSTTNNLCAQVLGRLLRKNIPERVGEGWEQESLTEAQIEYAAGDTYVSLAIYDHLSSIHIPTAIQVIDPLLSIGTPVLLFNNRRSVIAHATIIEQHIISSLNRLALGSAHVAIEVNKVVVPGALVHSH
jgi:3'-5' exonuclease